MLQDTPYPSTHTHMYLQTPPATGRRGSPAKCCQNQTTKASLPISPLPGPLTSSPSSKMAKVTPGMLSRWRPLMAPYRWTWSQRKWSYWPNTTTQDKEIFDSPAGILFLLFICHSQASSSDQGCLIPCTCWLQCRAKHCAEKVLIALHFWGGTKRMEVDR